MESFLSFLMLPSLVFSGQFSEVGTQPFSYQNVKDENVIEVEEQNNNIEPLSAHYYPNIDGFTHFYAYDTPSEKDCAPYGYFSNDVDIYKTKFTRDSDLILVRVETQVTPGHVHYRYSKEYSDYYIKNFRTIIDMPQVKDKSNGNTTSKLIKLASWPASNETLNYSISSTTGLSLSVGSSFKTGVSIDGRKLKVSTEGGTNQSLDFSYTSSTSMSGSDPAISTGNCSQSIAYNGYYWEADYYTHGRVTYTIDSWALYELIETDTIGFNPFSFYFSTSTDVTFCDVANNEIPPIRNSMGIYYNLGYMPDSKNVILM